MVDCPACGWVPVPPDQLPVKLPEVERYQATETGESPLALIADWVNTRCPKCGGPARRETDTMPNWAGSSWYFLRYCDPHNDEALADPERLRYWTPVDWYNGGMEHTTLHLLYSRFWHKFLYDIGVVPTAEPYAKRTSHGLILGENGEKMSKSRGNVVNPDDVVAQVGADAFRLYEVFMGAFDQPIPWSTNSLVGMSRFLQRVWELQGKVAPDAADDADTNRLTHQTIRHVAERIETLKFNTAVAALMTFANRLCALASISRDTWQTFLVLLSPFAPHISEELWSRLGRSDLACTQPWPAYDPEQAREEEVEIAVQVNGKVRSRITVPTDADRESLERLALADEKVREWTRGKTVRKVVVVPGRLVNIVVS
jgi:leucyl-tRNA synthetase